jgi:DnaK suppressor protein
MPGLAKKQQEWFRATLEAKQDELVDGLRRRDGIEVVTAPDALDNQQHALERELMVQNLERDSRLLRNVRAALRRLEQGEYGVCLSCDEEISPRRLAAVPWAPLCIRCQEEMDRGGLSPLQDDLAEVM